MRVYRRTKGFPGVEVSGAAARPRLLAPGDLSPLGERFGSLVVTAKADWGWMCRCDCGKYKKVKLSVLMNGTTKTCGHEKQRRDLIGRRFGRIAVTDVAGRGWMLCKCDCGKEQAVQTRLLLAGRAKSCGCRLKKNISGQRFGSLTAISVLPRKFDAGRGQRRWLAKCDCGNEVMVAAKSLMSGNSKSCGCLRQAQARVNEHYTPRNLCGHFVCLSA